MNEKLGACLQSYSIKRGRLLISIYIRGHNNVNQDITFSEL